jgi:receptor expression-enhancing protein 5/6
MSIVCDLWNSYTILLEEHLVSRIPIFMVLVERTGLSRSLLSSMIGAALCMCVMGGMGAESVTMLVGFMYPTYKSFKALRNNGRQIQNDEEGCVRNFEDDVQWLTYWVAFGFLSLVETLLGFALHWIPFYFILKLIMLVAMMHPELRIAGVFYRIVVGPLFERWEPSIDENLNKLSSVFDTATDSAAAAAKNALAQAVAQTALQ